MKMTDTDPLKAANAALNHGIDALVAGRLNSASRAFEESLTPVPGNHIVG